MNLVGYAEEKFTIPQSTFGGLLFSKSQPMRQSLLMMATSQSGQSGPIVQAVQRKLEAALGPAFLQIRNDSKGHASHYSDDGSEAVKSGETHLSVKIVSEEFEGLSRVKRHQLVYSLLDEEFNRGLHALQLDTKTSEEVKKVEK